MKTLASSTAMSHHTIIIAQNILVRIEPNGSVKKLKSNKINKISVRVKASGRTLLIHLTNKLSPI